MGLCLDHSFFGQSFDIVIPYFAHVLSPWEDVSHTFMTLTFDLNIKIVFFTMNLHLGKIVFAL